ncbi:BYPASS-related protein [Tanacetum coccineum]
MLSCYASSPLHSLEPLKDGWTDFHQEPLIPGISLKRPLSKEGDETLYQAWERYNDLLYKCPTYDINSHQKLNIFYNGMGSMNGQLLDSQGPIPGMIPAQALTKIQTMAGHSQKWHDGSTSRNVDNSSNPKGISTIVNKLDSLGRDIKKLKENVNFIQVGYQICGGAHLDKECPLNEEVKSIEAVKYGEFGPSQPFGNGAKFRVGPPGYYTRINNHPPFGEKNPSLEELMNKHLEESSRKRAEMEEWLKINNFLFPSDFMVMDMLNTRNETMILGRPFLVTIHARIDVFNKEISLGIGQDRVVFNMNNKTHNFNTPIGEIYMIKSTFDNEYTSHTSSDPSSRFEKTNDFAYVNIYCNELS